MPSVGTGAVPIQGVDQRVPTPGFDVSPNPLRAEPIESNAGPALNEAGNTLMHVFQAQKEHADAIDVATRMGQFQQDFGTAKTAALNSGQPAPDMVTNLQKAATDLTQQYTQGTTDPQNPNPPNRAVARELQLAMARHVAEQMGSFPSEAAVRVARDLDYRFNAQATQAAAQIGQQMQVVGPTDSPKFDFTPDGLQAANFFAGQIDKAFPPQARPTENTYYKQQLAQRIAMQGGMWVAANHPTLMQAYIDQHVTKDAPLLSPEQQQQLKNSANESMDGPMRQIEADGKAQEAQLYNQLLSAKSQGALSDSVVTQAVNTFKLPRELGEQLIGKQIEPQTIPATFNAVKASLDAAGTPEEIEMNLAGVGTPGSGINSTDAAKLRAYGAGLKPLINDPIRGARISFGAPGSGWLARQYLATTPSEEFDPMFKANAAINAKAAQNYFDSHADIVSKGKSDEDATAALRELATKAYQLNPRPVAASVKPDTISRVMAVPPAFVSGFDPRLRGGALPPMRSIPALRPLKTTVTRDEPLPSTHVSEGE